MDNTPLIFITGGVRSGKSAYAEQQLRQLAEVYCAKRLVYVATGVAFDEEMKKRIVRHQLDRRKQQLNWTTIEQPTKFSEVLKSIQLGDVILWDCVTTWLTNEFYEGFESGVSNWQRKELLQKRVDEMKGTVLRLHSLQIPMVIVSNEVLDEPLSKNEEVKLYQQYLGKLHQWFVKHATAAIEMEYGTIHQWK